jgi:glycosyltransferase involved in cell wall biosynthesis
MGGVDVVIAAWNARTTIAETLDSLHVQDVPGLHVIVVDDGSTDGTADVAAAYADRGVTCLRQANSGTCAAPRNAGLRASRAPFVCFFDADDVMNAGHLRHAVSLLEQHPDWVGVLGDYRNFDAGGPASATHFDSCPELVAAWGRRGAGTVLELPREEFRARLLVENFAISGSGVWRRAAVERLGGFESSLRASEDFHFVWRMAGLGPIGISSEEAFRRRLHEHNMSRKTPMILRYKAESRRRLAELEADPVLRAGLRRRSAEYLAFAAVADLRAGQGLGALAMAKGVFRGLRAGTFPTSAVGAWGRALARRAFCRP